MADVRDFNLESALAEALLRKNKIDEALEYARSASVEYSEDSSDWSALGHVYFLKNDFHNALAAWETAIVLKPENADNYQRVFFAYSRLALLLRDPARRTELLRNGIGFAETAAELGDQDTVVWAHFWSAMLASLVPDFDKAIAHCNIIQDKPPLKCFVAYLLGELNLQRGDYDSSFDAFAKAVKETWREIRTRRAKIKARTKRKTSAFHQLADDLAEWPLGAILCQSLLGLARGYAERDTGFDKALLGFVGQEIRAICARLSCQRHELGKDGCCLLRRLRGMDHYQTSSCSFRDAGTINIQKEWVDRQTSIGSH